MTRPMTAPLASPMAAPRRIATWAGMACLALAVAGCSNEAGY